MELIWGCWGADSPRLVTHVDDTFIEKVTQLYRQRIPNDAAVLDLMSSWVSHLPPERRYSKVVGHGMNAAEASGPFTSRSLKYLNLSAESYTQTYDHLTVTCPEQ